MAYCNGLENRRSRKRSLGSNPSPFAKYSFTVSIKKTSIIKQIYRRDLVEQVDTLVLETNAQGV